MCAAQTNIVHKVCGDVMCSCMIVYNTHRCARSPSAMCVCACVGACVLECTRLSTSLIQRGINPIHYLAGLRAAQSMALSVAADELPSLTRCIIQTCRRARLCLAFQSTKETEGQKFYLRETEHSTHMTESVYNTFVFINDISRTANLNGCKESNMYL